MSTFREYIVYSEEYLENAVKSQKSNQGSITERSVISCILFAWIAMESFINSMLGDFSALPPDTFDLNEQAFLTEKAIEFVDSGVNAGRFIVGNKKQYRPFEDKLLFLISRFGKNGPLNKNNIEWQNLQNTKQLRDSLTHPRKQEVIATIEDGKKVIESAKSIIELLSIEVWGKQLKW